METAASLPPHADHVKAKEPDPSPRGRDKGRKDNQVHGANLRGGKKHRGKPEIAGVAEE